MKTGLILEGGGLRGAFTAGVLDVFIKENITFDYACGVSSGAGVLYNFISKQEGRSKQLLLCPREHSYYGFREMMRSGHFMNINKFYGEMAFEDPPFDFDNYFASETEVEVVATNCTTGKAEYLKDSKTVESLFDCGRATGSLPFISGPYKIGDNYYMDGSVTDPLPIKRAQEKGCGKVVVLSTKAEGMNPSDLKKLAPAMRVHYRKFKPFVDAVNVRIPLLMSQYEMMEEMEKEGEVMVFNPEGHWDVSHMEKDLDKLLALYNEGVRQANERIGDLKEFLSE